MQRRFFLKGFSAAYVVVMGAQAFRAYGGDAPGKGSALEPWENWREGIDSPLVLVRAAILAASAVNTQPWLFRVTDQWIDLYADLRRNSGAFDPYLRELHISLGCALENLLLAAGAHGYKAKLTVCPGKLDALPLKPGPTRVARIDLVRGKVAGNELHDAIPRRHTNRAPFDTQKLIPREFVRALSRLSEGQDLKLFLFSADDVRKHIVATIVQASRTLTSDPQVLRDELLWIRKDEAEVEKYRDGVALESLALAAAGKEVKEAYPELLSTARLFGLIAVRDRYAKEQNLRAGRVWQRAHLLATVRGLAGRPANQAVELIDQERIRGEEPKTAKALAEFTGDATWQPTFMFYMGFPTREAPASARRPVEAVII